LGLLNKKPEWTDTPTNLHHEIMVLARIMDIDTLDNAFPKSLNALTRRLNELKSNLQNVGISFKEKPTRIGSKRYQRTISLALSPKERGPHKITEY